MGHDLSGSLQNAGGIGGLLSATFGNSTSTVFYCYDGNGNIADLASQNGTVVASYQYDPFAKLISATGDAGILAANNYLFSTKYQDRETGLLYYGYRYLSSELGRWFNRDPMEETVNLFVLVGNDPLNSTDPLGLVAAYGGQWTGDLEPWEEDILRKEGSLEDFYKRRDIALKDKMMRTSHPHTSGLKKSVTKCSKDSCEEAFNICVTEGLRHTVTCEKASFEVCAWTCKGVVACLQDCMIAAQVICGPIYLGWETGCIAAYVECNMK